MRGAPLPILLAVLLLVLSTISFAAETPPRTLFVKSKYFTVYGPAGMDVFSLLARLNYDYFLRVDGILDKGGSDPNLILGKTVDALFMESARILGINVYSLEATIEFLPDRNMVKVVIKNAAGIDVEERAFYLDELKTIYASIGDVSTGMLGHEMAHAIICHYFGAPPAANLQEILAGYVDYSLSKSVKNGIAP